MDPSTDGPAIRARIGVCPQEDTLDNELNVRDNLYIYGRSFGIPQKLVNQRVDELLEFALLTEQDRATVEEIPGGMTRQVTIAGSLTKRPRMLLTPRPEQHRDGK